MGGVKAGTKITADVAVQTGQKQKKKIAVRTRVTNEIVYLNAFKEEKVKTAPATT